MSSNKQNKLSEEEVEQFYRIKHALYLFANKKLNILTSKADFDDVRNNDLDVLVKVRDYVFRKNPSIIDEFIQVNPYDFSKDDLEILQTWKKSILADKFIIFRHTKDHSLLFGEDNVYGVVGLMDSFEELFGKTIPLFLDLIILPFKDKLTHEGICMPYNISIGRSMSDGIMSEAEEIILKKGVMTSLDKKENESSDEELLRFYMKSEKNQEFFFEKIEELKDKSANLKAVFNNEVARINSRHIKKQLKLQSVTGHFAILFSQVIASGRTKKELEENLNSIVPKQRLDELYYISIK
ncbi:hypothetical protein BVX95_01125 [archaeon D22]|nr:hypothetical protein BVX95_01125 [archaeon D22]